MRYSNSSDQCRNLYRFIRLVLGEQVSDREIARRWEMDEKNLRQLKGGVHVVPKLSRLKSLADVLGVNLVEAARAKLLENARKYPVERAKGNAKKYDALQP